MSGPICERTDCVMCRSGLCCALSENDFKKGKPCPFFKTKEQNDAELEARKERLAGLDKTAVSGYIEKYYKKIY